MSNSITREEILLSSIANEQNSNLSPITREEQYLSYIAGETNSLPTEPITRKEMLLDKIAKNGISGGGGIPDGYIKPEGTKEITENGEHDVTTYAKVNVVVSGGGDTEITLDAFIEETPTEVVLPTATKIRAYAFYQNGALRNIEMPKVISIANSAFYYCTLLGLTSLPSGLRSLGNNAFYQCTNLALTELPSGLTSLGEYAFYQCPTLTLTELPSGLTSLGNSAFYKCTNLALTELPSGLTSIGQYAFYQCSKLDITSIPDGVKSIDNNAFDGCTSLRSITFKGTPTSIKYNAFNGCTNLTTINVPWAEGAVASAPWGVTNATINYNYTGE